MRLFALTILISVSVLSAADFPADPSCVNVLDRALYRGTTPGEEHIIYITLYNTADSIGTVELQSGMRLQDGWYWETVCVWTPVDFQGNPRFIKSGSVLSVQRVNSSLLITWIDTLVFEYTEGLASLYLDYNLQSRGFEEFYMD